LARLHAGDDPRSSWHKALLAVARQPATWRHLPAFAVIALTVRGREGKPNSWPRARVRRVPCSVGMHDPLTVRSLPNVSRQLMP
jgi:hypothetical protein